MKLKSWAAVAAVSLAISTGTVQAQNAYPTKPITMIVPFAAGNSADILARILGEAAGRELGVNILVENRPGAESVLGAALAAKAKPDGYTIMLASTSALAAAAALNANLPYDPEKDFSPITQVSLQSYVVVVRPDHPAKTIEELVAQAKAEPTKVTFASSNTTTRVASELLGALSETKLTNIPYTGTEQAFLDVRNGQVHLMFAGSTSAMPLIKQGLLRPLAVSSRERWANLPDVPALGESVTGYDFSAWHALVAPKGTPPEAVAKLNAAFTKAMQDPEIAKRVDVQLFPTTPEALQATISNDISVWRRIVDVAGIPVNK